MEFKLDEQFCKISELALHVDKIITEAEKAGILNDENDFSFSEIWELSAIAYLASTKGDANHGI